MPTTRPELIFSRFHTVSLDSGLGIGWDRTALASSAELRIDTL